MSGSTRWASAARHAVDDRREGAGELGERHRTIGADVEHAVMQLDSRIIDSDRGRRRPTDAVATGTQRDPTLAGRPDQHGDIDAVELPTIPSGGPVPATDVARGRLGRDRDGRSDAESCGDQAVMRATGRASIANGVVAARSSARARSATESVACVRTHEQARSVGSGRFARRDGRVLHADTVGGRTARMGTRRTAEPARNGPLTWCCESMNELRARSVTARNDFAVRRAWR